MLVRVCPFSFVLASLSLSAHLADAWPGAPSCYQGGEDGRRKLQEVLDADNQGDARRWGRKHTNIRQGCDWKTRLNFKRKSKLKLTCRPAQGSSYQAGGPW